MTDRQILTTLAALTLACAAAVRLLPEPDPSVTFTCPNFAGRLSRTGTLIPAQCGDTTAVTFGYLR